MKKNMTAVAFLVTLLLVAGQSVNAQYDRMNLSMSFGTVTDDNFSFSPFIWTTGLNLDMYLTDSIIFSPEFFIYLHKFSFSTFWIAPAALINLDMNGFIIGGGITKMWLAGDDVEGSPSSDLSLKLNAGYIGEGMRFSVFLTTTFKDIFQSNLIGAAFGFFF